MIIKIRTLFYFHSKGFTKNTKMDRKIGYFVFFVLVFLCELCGLSFYEKAMDKVELSMYFLQKMPTFAQIIVNIHIYAIHTNKAI